MLYLNLVDLPLHTFLYFQYLDGLLLQLRPPQSVLPAEHPVDYDTIVPLLGPASPLAINIMQFMENGLFDVDDDIWEASAYDQDAGDDQVGLDEEGNGGTAEQALREPSPAHVHTGATSSPAPVISSAPMSSNDHPLLPPHAPVRRRPVAARATPTLRPRLALPQDEPPLNSAQSARLSVPSSSARLPKGDKGSDKRSLTGSTASPSPKKTETTCSTWSTETQGHHR